MNIKLSLVGSTVLLTTLNATQSVDIVKGWNLIGTMNDINVSELSDTRIVFYYDNGIWKAKISIQI